MLPPEIWTLKCRSILPTLYGFQSMDRFWSNAPLHKSRYTDTIILSGNVQSAIQSIIWRTLHQTGTGASAHDVQMKHKREQKYKPCEH